MEEIVGTIERITYQNPENGFSVVQMLEPKQKQTTCVVGPMPTVQPGETVRCSGAWKMHATYGKQFIVETYRTEAPANIVGIRKYLGSGLIKGIGPAFAERIVKLFGAQTLDVIEQTPDRLHEVPGIGEKRVEKIKVCWAEQKAVREVMVFLQTYGISPVFSQKIFRTYGQQSISVLKENPYRLAQDIHGIGFKSADKVAQKLGIPKDAPQRIAAGIEYTLNELSDDGHVCYPKHQLVPKAVEMLEVPPQSIENELVTLKEEDRIVIAPLLIEGAIADAIWITSLYLSEMGIVNEIRRLKSHASTLRMINAPKALEWVQEKLQISLAENQKLAVAKALSEKLQIITGGPGTGKSTITNAILRITEKLTDKILLAAPTGRAAKRMTEITGQKASTIHSLLEFDPKGKFKRNRKNPLAADLIIIDEASMIDTFLMFNLLKAIPNDCRLLFVGDINQLPSVGPGNVLKDLIASCTISTTTLNEIFRQAQGSRIVTNAHRINKGIFPEISHQQDSDFYFLKAEENEKVLQDILTLVSSRLPKRYQFDPIFQIQVLAPMKRGVIGTENLNEKLQEILNPGKTPVIRYGRRFCLGDKVMQIRNNYDRGVFNGDVGIITHIDLVEQELIVKVDDKPIAYDFADLDELVLAYAVSVHKYQGSECPCIVIPIHISHFKLLTRNLLYTGVTRGKQLVVLVGSPKALAIAVRNDDVKTRYTGLVQALREKALASKL